MTTALPSNTSPKPVHNLLVIEKKSLDSTQDEAKRLLSEKAESISLPYVVIAGEQTHGRGRSGRKWISPAGKNIYFSLVIDVPPHWKQATHLLSTCVSLSLFEQLKAWSIPEIAIKWPNDLVIKDKKLSGVLVEIISQAQSVQAIIGVGMNVNLQSDECEKLIDRPITSLLIETNQVWNVEKTTYTFLEKILHNISLPEISPEYIYNTWIQECSWMIGKFVATHHPDGRAVQGTVLGFSNDGAVRIYNTTSGQEELIDCGLD